MTDAADGTARAGATDNTAAGNTGNTAADNTVAAEGRWDR